MSKIQVRQRGAVREGIQSPCGSEQSKYRQRCQGVQVSDGLGGQRFKLAISGREARARTLEPLAIPQVECDESGAFGEWFKRPWGEQWAKGPEVSVNLHWWPRRSVLQVGDFEAAGRGHGPVSFSHRLKTSVTRAVQLASGSSDPGRSSGQRVQRCQ